MEKYATTDSFQERGDPDGHINKKGYPPTDETNKGKKYRRGGKNTNEIDFNNRIYINIVPDSGGGIFCSFLLVLYR